MKLVRFTLALSTLAMATASIAGTLTTAKGVEFLAFDGQKVKKGTTSLTINDNQIHQAVVEVSSIYREGSDENFYESSPLIVTFQAGNENIIISAPKLSSQYEVKKFQSAPTLKVATSSGKTVENKQDVLKGDGFLSNLNITDNIARYNASENKAAVKTLGKTDIPAAITTNDKANKGKVTVQGENVAEQQLQYWFQQADKATQKRFLDWAKKQ